MAIGIVEQLEVIDVDHQQRQLAFGLLGLDPARRAARIPRSCLSFAVLRLKLTRDIFAPDPTWKVEGRFRKPFPDSVKLELLLKYCDRQNDMVPENSSPLTAHLPNGLSAVEQEIARACKQARRDRASVTLIAVSKTFDAGAITPIIEAGQRAFGENRVQEAKAKWPGLMSAYPGLALHLIGPLQSNKVKEAVALFDAIHSVDRPSICEALAKETALQQRQPQLFVQLNTGEEPQKAGVAPAQADAFIASCREKYGLSISGLMCIPPVNEAPAPHFALTAKIAARNGLKNLSMGMSADFAVAIQFGATHVRVGSAIFGHR